MKFVEMLLKRILFAGVQVVVYVAQEAMPIAHRYAAPRNDPLRMSHGALHILEIGLIENFSAVSPLM